MTEQIITLSQIAAITGEPQHRVRYAVERHGPAPVDRIGTTRLWRRDDLPAIREALARTASAGPNRRRQTEERASV